MILKVLTWPDPTLSEISKHVRNDDIPKFRDLINDMVETMEAKRAHGLAAIQIGVPARVFVMQPPKDMKEPTYAYFNPEIHERSKKPEILEEGCLSFPGVTEMMSFDDGIILEATDIEGKRRRWALTGYYARCAQHEIEHLNGYTMLDRMGKLAKKMFLKRYEKARAS